MFAPEKQRSRPNSNWPLRTCCGCIPNPAGMIVLGVLTILGTLYSALNLQDQNRAATSENLCKDSSVMDATKPMRAMGAVMLLVSIVAGILFLYLGVIGCQLQGMTTGAVQQTGACGRQTGINVGKGAIGCALLMYLFAVIFNLLLAGGAKGIAKANCCTILEYAIQENDLEQEDNGDWEWADSKTRNNLEACGFKSGRGFEGIDPKADNPFKTDAAEKKVEDSGTAGIIMAYGLISTIFTLLCCGCCTAFVYSATYEVSEAGTGATGGSTSVGAV